MRRLFLAGLGIALLVGLAGLGLERVRFGATDEEAAARVVRGLRTAVAARTASLEAVATAIARDPSFREALAARHAAQLFDLLDRVTAGHVAADLSVTIYSPAAEPIAWHGRPSDLGPDRLFREGVFVAPGPQGRRQVYVLPITTADHVEPGRGALLGAIAAERVLIPSTGMQHPAADEPVLTTPLARVQLHTGPATDEGADDPFSFTLTGPDGRQLVRATVDRADLAEARLRWRRHVLSAVLLTLAITVTLIVVRRLGDGARGVNGGMRRVLGTAALVIVAAALCWLAIPLRWSGTSLFSSAAYASWLLTPILRTPADLLLLGVTLGGLVMTAADGLAIRRARHGVHARAREGGPALPFAVAALGGGVVLAGLLVLFSILLRDTIANTSLDIFYLTLVPWHSARLAIQVGLLLLHAATIWAGVLVLLASVSAWRVPRRLTARRLLTLALWSGPGIAVALVAWQAGLPLPVTGMILSSVAVAALAWLLERRTGWYRHASEAFRLAVRFAAVLVPALLLYPSGLYYTDRARQHLIETQYAIEAKTHTDELRTALRVSEAQIDGIPDLAARIAHQVRGSGPPSTELAFSVWRQTDLATLRLTSAIELYNRDGVLVSRFALNFPEYAATEQRYRAHSCEWELFGEAAPFGSEERRMLHAERGFCAPGAPASSPEATIVVHVMLDFSALEFLSTRSPYFEFFRGARPTSDVVPGRDVELVIYGWGRSPIYASRGQAWPLTGGVFDRIYRSREPFWTTLSRGDTEYRVHFANDRAGIYAVGYPVRGLFDHLVQLAELSTLTGLTFIALLASGSLLRRLARVEARLGRQLAREFRTSFYRKLFLAFVASAVLPAIVLALLIRAYVANRLRADVEAEAARTAAVAQRVTEESLAAQQSTATDSVAVSDDVTVLISRLIDQDVNIFEGPTLLATSERDLFASGLLPTRVPPDVYRAITLERLPSFVGEDRIADLRYLLAAAPIRAGARDLILTVPLGLRQQEIEREIDELDRGVLLGAVLFIMLGAGLGFWMAERIGEPVQRLTRATRRIAAGDLDARVLVKTADELQRLVEAFNAMAEDLKRQRAQLERTHRLEAWADMARQVAHDIKNPLTPIQLSAEHLRRVHRDRGAPLGPVVDSCIDTILTQVRLLRSIASEFASFASSPVARPTTFQAGEVVEEIVSGYRLGLEGRVSLRVDMAPDLPPVFADRTLLARALTNVIENALHAMPGPGSLIVRGSLDDGLVRLDVTDTGVGIDEDSIGRLFEPYFSTKSTGTGLGLTIAKRNVELIGGRIAVESRRGHGTTVTIYLPAAPAPAEPRAGAVT